jgi:hypothetical protein
VEVDCFRTTRNAVILLSFGSLCPLLSQPAPAAGPSNPKVLEEGILPGSIRIRGSGLSLKLGGYVKLDFIQDFDPIGNIYQFKTDSIPVRPGPNDGEGGQTTLHARETRFLVDLRGDGSKFRAYFEGDFYGDGNTFRIRHAYGQFGNLLAGQDWSTFQDISTRPRTLDYEGPDGEVFIRQAQVRWTQALSKDWKFAVAAEEPGSQFAVPDGLSGTPRNNVPDIPGFLRFDRPRGHFQVAGILRQIRFDGVGDSADRTTRGWGFNSTFRFNTAGKNALMGQFAFGNGLGRYIESMSGQNVDAAVRDGGLKALPIRTFLAAYEHHWTPRLQSTFAAATARVSLDAAQPASTLRITRDIRGNLIWSMYRMVDLGAEMMFGRREDLDGRFGTAVRLQFAAIFKFN